MIKSGSSATATRFPGEIDGRAWPQPDWPVFLMALGGALYLYVSLFILPAIPILQSGDQFYFWAGAQRMWYGDHIYRDFFEATPPGTELLYLGLLKTFGIRVWLPNVVDLCLGMTLSCACFGIAAQIMSRRLAGLAALFFLVVIYGKSPNGTHHWFSILAVMCATAVVIRRRTSARITIAGGLLGLASFFTQTHGAFAALGTCIFLAWEEATQDRDRRRLCILLGCCLIGFVGVLGTLSIPYVLDVGMKRLWYFQVTYVVKYFAHGQHPLLLGVPLSRQSAAIWVQHLFVYAALPIVYTGTLWYCWRARNNPTFHNWPKIALLSLIGLSLLLESVFGPNYVRIYVVSMPGIILAVWAMAHAWRFRSYAITAAWALIVVLGVRGALAKHRDAPVIARFPAGLAATSIDNHAKLNAVMQRTRPGDCFFQATWPGMYLPLQLRNPAFLNEVTENDSTRPEDVERSVRDLEARQVRYVLWSEYNDAGDADYPGTFHLEPLRGYIHGSYRLVQMLPDREELWERKSAEGTVPSSSRSQ